MCVQGLQSQLLYQRNLQPPYLSREIMPDLIYPDRPAIRQMADLETRRVRLEWSMSGELTRIDDHQTTSMNSVSNALAEPSHSAKLEY